MTVEIKDLKWHPFDNNLTIEIPDYILNKKVQRFSVKGRVEAVSKIVIGKYVREISVSELKTLNNLEYIGVTMFNQYFSSENGALYNSDKTKLLYWPTASKVLDLSKKDNLKIIGESAFSENTNLTTIFLPKTITDIEDDAFRNCENIKVVDFSKCHYLKNIDNNAFGNCKNITKVDLSKCHNLKNIGINSFNNCENLEEIIFSEDCKLEQIGGSAFKNCINLKSIKIPKYVKKIGYSAFYDCRSLKTVEFEEGSLIEEIGELAFCNCSFKKIALPNSVIKIHNFCFSYNDDLEIIILSDCLTEIGIGSFSNCTSLKEIEIPSLVHTLKMWTFQNCINLIDVKLPVGLNTIEGYAFDNCLSLKTIELPENIINIEGSTFKDCKSLEKIILPAKLVSISSKAFEGCSSLKEVEMPELLEKIDDYAFYECKNLSTITINKKIKDISKYAFLGCDSLSKVIYLGNKFQWALINIEDDNILSIYIGFYHPELMTRYGINIVCPIDFVTKGVDSSGKFNVAEVTKATKKYSFHPNGGAGIINPVAATIGQPFDLPGKGIYVREGHTLTEWNTQSDGTGTSYTLGEAIVPTQNQVKETVLYAQWNKIETKVFNYSY